MKNTRNCRKGLSPFIASVLTILFGIMMLVVVLNVINPVFNQAEDSSIVTDAFQNLNLLHSTIEEVASEAQGSKRTVSVSVSDGDYFINTTTDLLVFDYTPSEIMDLRGTRGDIDLELGLVFVDYFNWYVDGSDATSVWTSPSGQWNINSYKYMGNGGMVYRNLSSLESVRFSGDIYNSSGIGGQIFITPANPERLIGFWGFDNESGTKAYDFSGNMNNGTLTNNPTRTSNGKVGSVIDFDGDNDYVYVADSSDLDVDYVTLSAWIYVDEYKDDQRIISREYGTGNPYNIYSLLISGSEDKHLQFRIARDGIGLRDIITDDAEIPLSTWTHVAATYNGSAAVLYVNGDLVVADYNLPGVIMNDDNPVLIGASEFYSRYFNGKIDEVKLWDIALTEEQISAEYYLSQSKLFESGFDTISTRLRTGAIVLSNPDGVTSFDNIKVSTSSKEQTFVVPYSRIDLTGTLRISKGDYKVTIEHMGTNTTLNKPIIQVTSS